ncbi:hypothetical protein SEPCBS119000_001256 [Sporothrix epigloea]|uniref:Zn(2)-C6 fungal-type domain-containing protein n=1 Tax=Sporothrix epigloea TaxID=1892477 RepID=A0ABP0D9R3_9PEZI
MSHLSEDSDSRGLDDIDARSSSSPGFAVTAAGRPYYAKRPHKKSRAGCINCKTRKVKCNEERPRCRACTLRRESCVYPSAVQTSNTSTATSAAPPRTARSTAAARAEAASLNATAASRTPMSSYLSPSSSSSESGSVVHYSQGTSPATVSSADDLALATWGLGSSRGKPRGLQYEGGSCIADNGFHLVNEPLYVPAAIDQVDMKLLWFYTIKGYDGVAAEAGYQPKVDEILQVAIPQHAFATPFLMDCLLALSALQLQLHDQPIAPSRVLTYRARAFAGYRKAVEEATPERYPALLACSLLLCALSSEMFRDAESTPLYILDWMVVWRGIGLMVKTIDPDILIESNMHMLFARPPINLDSSTKHIPNQLLFMVSSIGHDDPDFTHIDAYYKTLKLLGSLYRELESGIGRILSLRIITWLTFLPKSFVDIARERRPRALVILAHYLAFVKLCNRLWWMRGIADKEIRDILNVLEESWLTYIKGPIAVLDTTDDIEIGKILLNDNSWKPAHFHDPVRDEQTKGLTLVDDCGHNIVYNGTWLQADTGKEAVWNIQETLCPVAPTFEPGELSEYQQSSVNDPEVEFVP